MDVVNALLASGLQPIGILVAAKARGEVERLALLLGDLRASGLW